MASVNPPASSMSDADIERERESTGSSVIAADKVAGRASTESKAWMGAGATAVVGGVGGALWWSRRNRKKTDAQQLEAARTINPEDVDNYAQQPTHVLRVGSSGDCDTLICL